MANEFAGEAAHSAEYFGDTRDYWHNPDFLQFLRDRWALSSARSVLDVGSGAGHWSRAVASLVSPDASLVGIDREKRWIEVATARASAAGVGERFRYQEANAEALPFPDDSFDLVTCQTVLIHCPDPQKVLAEMVRVTKPGGRVLVVEPNNLTGSLLGPQALTMSVPDLLAIVELELRCERGKTALGEGNNSLGEAVPALFHAAGLHNVRTCLNDRAVTLLPPYAVPGAREWIEESEDSFARGLWMWDPATTLRYFLAGGGTEGVFPDLWATAGRSCQRVIDEVRAGTYTQSGGFILYFVCGTKA